MPFKATPKPHYVTHWWSNHFISQCQNLYKITANDFISSMVSCGSVPRTKSYLSVLFTGAHIFSVGIECHAVAGTAQQQTAHIRTLRPRPPDDSARGEEERSHLPILPNFSLSGHTLVHFTFSRVWRAVFWQQPDCPILPQRKVEFIFPSRMEKSLRHDGKWFLQGEKFPWMCQITVSFSKHGDSAPSGSNSLFLSTPLPGTLQDTSKGWKLNQWGL